VSQRAAGVTYLTVLQWMRASRRFLALSDVPGTNGRRRRLGGFARVAPLRRGWIWRCASAMHVAGEGSPSRPHSCWPPPCVCTLQVRTFYDRSGELVVESVERACNGGACTIYIYMIARYRDDRTDNTSQEPWLPRMTYYLVTAQRLPTCKLSFPCVSWDGPVGKGQGCTSANLSM
jgi:hypothetical protein